MKKSYLVAPVLAFLVSFFAVWSAFGADLPTTTSSSTASAVEGEQFHGPVLMNDGDPFVGAINKVVPFRALALGTPESWFTSKTAISDWIGETFVTTPGGEYQACNGKIQWQDTILANPTTPWPVLQQLIEVSSVNGGNSVSLSMIRVRTRSTGPSGEGPLSDTYTVGNLGYSEAAVGIRSDGTRITSGQGDQKVARVVFITQMKLFTGGETQQGLDAVENWVMAQNNFTITYEVTLTIEDALDPNLRSVGHAMVSIRGPVGPTLTFDRFGRNHIYVTGAQPRATYVVEISENVTGPWRPVMSIITDDRGETWLGLSEKSQPQQFFRLRAD